MIRKYFRTRNLESYLEELENDILNGKKIDRYTLKDLESTAIELNLLLANLKEI